MTSTAGSTVRFSFLCGIRGYHEILRAQLELHNPHDSYAIAVMKKLPGMLAESVVGHLPREISRLTYFIILHGGRASCKIKSVQYRRSPLIQGGLEIPAEVTIEMDISENNVIALQKYEELVHHNYKEPVDGAFEDATDSILAALKHDSDSDEIISSESDTDEEEAS